MPSANLQKNLTEINELVVPVIKELLAENVEGKNHKAIFYQCEVGGKRIRSVLVVISGQIFGGNVKELLYPAASIEILHNATLVVDDIIDHSDFRRNEPTCWNKYGRSIAECISFTYLASVFAGLCRVGNSSKLINLYSSSLKILVDGEIKDILFERSGREDENYVVENRYKIITKDDCLEMMSQKTAVLLQASCKAGAICANASDDQVQIMGDFGFNLGMAFQIRDDILDIFGNEKEFGKKVGKDIIDKKMGNIVILSAIDQLELDEKNIIRDLLGGSDDISSKDIETIITLIKKTNAKYQAETAASSYIQNALKLLKKLPQNKYNETLSELAEYIINREK